MKRLSRFEVDCLVDVIENKVKEIEREKLVKECSEKVKEWNDELKLILSEKKIWSDKLCKRIEEIEKEVEDKNWNGINVYNDDCYSDVEDMVFINESKNYYEVKGYGLRSKISNEIIINSLKGNDIDSLINSLVDKFKS
jgi:ATP-dependent protease HslVU (ClpYQ) peptidase subunit